MYQWPVRKTNFMAPTPRPIARCFGAINSAWGHMIARCGPELHVKRFREGLGFRKAGALVKGARSAFVFSV